MTFMDDTHHSNEVLSRNAARQLQMWLLTIAPVSAELYLPMLDALDKVIDELGWVTEFDGTFDRWVLV